MLDLLAAAIRIATPLLLAATGGLLSERAGVFAVGLEGMMLAGAFASVLGAAAGGIVAAVVSAALAGVLVALAVALVSVRWRADGMVTGLTANVLAIGATSYAHALLPGFLPSLAPLEPWRCPILADLPVLGPLFREPPLTWLAVALLFAAGPLLGRTRAGLSLRAVGENPEAVFAAGLHPLRIRFNAVLGCGAIAGIGGAVLPLQQVGGFTDDMTGGRGYLALAALIVGRWHPLSTAAACLVFGAAEALELQLEARGIEANPYLLQMLPYVTALAVLAVLGRSGKLPTALGQTLP